MFLYTLYLITLPIWKSLRLVESKYLSTDDEIVVWCCSELKTLNIEFPFWIEVYKFIYLFIYLQNIFQSKFIKTKTKYNFKKEIIFPSIYS